MDNTKSHVHDSIHKSPICHHGTPKTVEKGYISRILDSGVVEMSVKEQEGIHKKLQKMQISLRYIVTLFTTKAN